LTRADVTEIKPVLYGLEKLNEAPEGSLVFVVEGEKDVETAWAQGFRATCNPMGAGKAENVDWGPLAKMQVIIIADKDKDEDENHKKGRHHARDVKRLAIEAGAEVLGIIECPKGAKDLTDHIEAGGDMDELVRMVITARKGNDISLEHIYSRAGIGLGPTGLPADRIPTGFEKFDRLTLGIGRTWYISLLALQGVGKSTLAYQWALFAARNGYRVLIISTEMSPEETKETIAVQISGISRDRIAYGLVEAEAESFKAAEKEIAGLPILFDTIDPTAANPSETLTKKIRDCDICIVDHLTYLGLSLENAGRTDWKSILAVTKILVRIAESKRIPIIGIGHLNRQAEAARARGEAQGAEHTAGAFLIHAEAKLSLILENPRGAANREYRYLRIIKSRFSAGTGQALRLHFDGEHAKFTEEDFGEPVIEKPRWEPREKDDFQ
jgi:hypothetical protein